jgi:aspartyl-tRNA(Asn)/glutamyl-tRNA(Gln) amidotransferase subunit A
MPDLVATLDEPLPVPRIGRVRGLFDVMADVEMRTLMDRVEDQFRAWGATVVPAAMPGAFAEVLGHHRTIMAVEAASYHGQRMRRHPDDYPPNVAGLIEEGLSSPAAAYHLAMELQKELSRDVSASFREVDVLLTPATRGPAPDPSTTGDPAFNSPWSFTGLPTVSFTAGWTADGLPLAIQLVGPAWSEAELFAAAAWCESALELERKEPPL